MKKNRLVITWLLVSVTLMLTACRNPPPPDTTVSLIPEGSRIQNTRTGALLTPEQLLNILSEAPMVIVGEEHTNRAHHDIELWIVKNFERKRPQGSLLLEMITQDQQPAVNNVKQILAEGTLLPESRIQEALHWNAGWPWSMYGEIVMTGLRGHSPLLSANLSRTRISDIYKNPGFPAGKQSSQSGVRDTLSHTITRMHGGDITPNQLNAMLAIQQHRDRFMAQQLVNAPQPGLLLVGGYHAAKDVGVPVHIQDINGQQPVVLMLSTLGSHVSTAQADYVWYTPAVKK